MTGAGSVALVKLLGSPIVHWGSSASTLCGIEASTPFPRIVEHVQPDGSAGCRTCDGKFAEMFDRSLDNMVLGIPMMNAAVVSPLPRLLASPASLASAGSSAESGPAAPVLRTPPVVSGTTGIIETSMSALDTFSRCRRKYLYQEVLGWSPREASKPMLLGTLYHAGLAAGYRAVRDYDAEISKRNDNNRAITFIEAATAEVQTVESDRDGRPLALDLSDRDLVEDMVRYWFTQAGETDLLNIERVVLVEEPLYIQVGQYRIRCTVDAVVKYFDQDRLVIVDHKTGDPKEGKAWIRLDLQTGIYYVAGRGRFGQVLQFSHRFMDRDVPPGFGHRSVLTDTGKPRSAATLASMQDPTRYVAAYETSLSDAQLDAYTAEIVEIIQEIDHAKATNRWTRSRIKIGPMACSACPYFEVCTAERDGYERIDDEMAQQMFNVKERS